MLCAAAWRQRQSVLAFSGAQYRPFLMNVSGIPKGQVPLAGAWGRRPHMAFRDAAGRHVQAVALSIMAKAPGLTILMKYGFME